MEDYLSPDERRARSQETEKTYYILRAFGEVTKEIEEMLKRAPPESYETEDSVFANWMRYRNIGNRQICLSIRNYFVEYYEGQRWTMEGAHPDSRERQESYLTLRRSAYEGLTNAMAMYEARTPKKPRGSASPIASGNPYGPAHPTTPDQMPADDPKMYERFYPYGEFNQLIMPPLDYPPSPVGSTGSGRMSNFSTDSNMMFSMEK